MEKHYVVVTIVTLLSIVYCVTAGLQNNVYTRHSDFEIVASTTGFVDKSMLLKHILRMPEMKLVTAPRRFGKSTNLDMVKKFCSVPVNKNGKRVNRNRTKVHGIFKKLEIYKDRDFFYSHFGLYPVLFLDLKCDEVISNYEDAFSVLREKIRLSFKNHQYLINSSKLSSTQRKLCDLWCDELSYITLNKEHIKGGLINLAEYLRIHFDRKVFVLVDEYDSIVVHALFAVIKKELKNIINLVMNKITALCKSNNNVEYCLITGISYLAGGGFSNLNNVEVSKFLDNHQLVDFYGFLEAEVDKLFKSSRFGLDEEKIKQAKLWYNGYICRQGRKMYSPYSVLKFLKNGIIKNYWADSGHIENIKIIFQRPSIMTRIENLLASNNISINIIERVRTEHLKDLKDIYCNNKAIINHDLLFSYLVDIGYLTFSHRQYQTETALVRIPNLEIEDSLLNEIVTAYEFTNETYLKGIFQNILKPFKKCFKFPFNFIKKSPEMLKNTYEFINQDYKSKRFLNVVVDNILRHFANFTLFKRVLSLRDNKHSL